MFSSPSSLHITVLSDRSAARIADPDRHSSTSHFLPFHLSECLVDCSYCCHYHHEEVGEEEEGGFRGKEKQKMFRIKGWIMGVDILMVLGKERVGMALPLVRNIHLHYYFIIFFLFVCSLPDCVCFPRDKKLHCPSL